MRRSGFTLIELLVVIAIIAILAAILFPVFARARAKAQQNNCLSNTKQLALGVLMYVSDSDDRMPPAWEGGTGTGLNWANCIYPYIKNIQIYNCPSSTQTAYYSAGGAGYGINQKICALDYAMNGCLGSLGCGPGCSTGTWPPLKQANIYRPAEMIMLFGSAWWCFYTANPDVAAATYTSGPIWESSSYNPTYYCPSIETRHNEGGNVAYVDGHAKWLGRAKLYSWAAADLTQWNNTP